MAKSRKESVQFNISVEGVNCEKMYFEYLGKLINTSDENKYNAKINCRKASPKSFAKRNAHLALGTGGKKKLPYFHIQDIEDYDHEEERKRFYSLIDELRNTEKDFGVKYELGYTNYTFELWMLLHAADMSAAVTNRYSYLAPINRYFHKSYSTLDEFKKENEFQKILDEYVTLDSVRLAVKRAEKITAKNAENGKTIENYKKFSFYRENPDLSIHNIIRIMFKMCGLPLYKETEE